jgi:hypothetical protein
VGHESSCGTDRSLLNPILRALSKYNLLMSLDDSQLRRVGGMRISAKKTSGQRLGKVTKYLASSTAFYTAEPAVMRKQRFLMWHFKNRRVCFAVADQFDSRPGWVVPSDALLDL